MSSTAIVPALQEFVGLRYFSVVSFVLVVFDHLISLDHEVNTIWRNPNVSWHSKVAFVANRYLTEVILALVVYIFSGTATGLDTTVCQRFLWVYGITVEVVGAASHFVIMLRVYGLWDHRKSAARILIATFTVCISTATILGIFTAIELQPQLTYFEPLHTCHFGIKPKIISVMLGVLSFFDFAVVILVIYNAMARPRLSEVPIVSELQKDGVGFFLTTCVLRFADVIISVFQDAPRVFLAMTTVWALCVIINARLHMRLEGLALGRVHGRVIMLEDMQYET